MEAALMEVTSDCQWIQLDTLTCTHLDTLSFLSQFSILMTPPTATDTEPSLLWTQAFFDWFLGHLTLLAFLNLTGCFSGCFASPPNLLN